MDKNPKLDKNGPESGIRLKSIFASKFIKWTRIKKWKKIKKKWIKILKTDENSKINKKCKNDFNPQKLMKI